MDVGRLLLELAVTAPKARGTALESLIVGATNLFAAGRLKAYRPAQAGFNDVGDVHGVSPFIIQAKDYKDLATALREGLAGAVAQARRAGEDYGVAVIKRRGKSIGESYAVMRYEDFVRVLLRLRRAEALALPGREAETDRQAPFPTAADVARARKEEPTA